MWKCTKKHRQEGESITWVHVTLEWVPDEDKSIGAGKLELTIDEQFDQFVEGEAKTVEIWPWEKNHWAKRRDTTSADGIHPEQDGGAVAKNAPDEPKETKHGRHRR